ncbi:MAG: hypothetical protein ACRBCJ_02835 [Hyphomicrobiaceae bacterium]
MTPAPRQLILDLPHRSAFGAEDFFVSQSNSAAVKLIDQWPNWQHWAAVVSGPPGAGKSHLASVWRQRSNAMTIAATDLTENAVEGLLEQGALCVEDLDRGIGEQTVLFHLLNVARERKLSILLTARAAPGELDISLPDLRSRLRALPLVKIQAPDESLLKAVLVKLFSDRQLIVDPQLIDFMAARMERTMDGATTLVSEIDKLALAMRRRVTRTLALEALNRLADIRDTK